MFRIRFHGRGGQGVKTASRILGTAFFLEGYEVQDAPRYGAERRGAPIFAYVRAAHEVINERGIIHQPDLVVVADDSLVSIPAAGVLQGLTKNSVLFLTSHENADIWRQRLHLHNPVIVFPEIETSADPMHAKYVGAQCAGAAAALVRVIPRAALERAVLAELSSLDAIMVAASRAKALAAFDWVHAREEVRVTPGTAITVDNYRTPAWMALPFDTARVAAPTIFAAATSIQTATGLWRTMRPVIDYERCKQCWWVCSSFCPDSAINVSDGKPAIDYDHCKGCLICVAQCPPHAIEAIAESTVQQHVTETLP